MNASIALWLCWHKKRRGKPRRGDSVFAEVLVVQSLIDVADHAFVGSQRLFARGPFGRAGFVGVGGAVDVRFHHAHEFLHVAAHVVEVHGGTHELAFGADNKRAAQGEAGGIIVYTEQAGDDAGGIGGERVVHIVH